MAMIQTIDELKKAQGLTPGVVRNEIDDPNALSVSSIAPLDEEVGDLEGEEKEEQVGTEKKEEAVASKPEVKKEEDKKSSAPSAEAKELAQKRINDLTKKRRETERQLEFEKNKRQEAEEELRKLKSKIPATDRPKKADFEDEDAYLEALIEWKAEQKIRGIAEAAGKVQKETKEKEVGKETDENLDTMMERGREAYTDFDEIVMDKNLVLSKELIEATLFAKEPEKILYYLGKNPDEAASLSELDPLQIVYELGRISAGMTAEFKGKNEAEVKKEEKPSAPLKKITKAPEPIVPVKQSGAVEKDPADMSPREYRAWREKNK